MMQSLAEERVRQRQRLERKLHRSKVKRMEARAQELGRELDDSEKEEIGSTLAVIYEREVSKMENSFDEQELQAIVWYGSCLVYRFCAA